MRHRIAFSVVAVSLAMVLVLTNAAAHAQVTGAMDVNLSKKTGDQTECAIAKNPKNKQELFALCNTPGFAGLFAARSTNGGASWTYPDPADKTIADGDAGQGPAGWCDPTLAWDSFGNLFITYIDQAGGAIITILSTDGGLTFTNLASFPGSVDQPTVVAANTTAPKVPVAVWIVYNESGQMRASGAAVTGLGIVGAFGAVQTIPGTMGCSYGDIAIAPTGVVVQVCQNPTGGQGPATIFTNTDSDGLGPGNFGAAVTVTTTNVGGYDYIPAQNVRSVDAEAGLAYDANDGTIPNPPTPPGPSPHFGRLYLVYTDEVGNESNDLDIMLRFSDNDGATWSPAIRVNDDAPGRSQFFPRIASNVLSGNIAICWADCRNSATNTGIQEFCTIANPAGFPAFIGPNVLIGNGTSTSNSSPNEFGDYAGLAYFQGVAHPIWGDTSNVTLDNPNLTANIDAYTDRVSGGVAANEGDPHITTVDGIHYDFQSAGEFVALRDRTGFEIQTRQTAVATTFNPGANAHTGLATCVSLNTAVAARVGAHSVTYEPNLSGVPDPSGLQLRVDGALQTLGASGINLTGGGRILQTAAPGGIEIDFPSGTMLNVTPGWWASQGKWYLNVDVFRTGATEGIMGEIAQDSWLPALPNGSSMGPRPAALHQRYVDLYQKFADAWRVTDRTSLFDYAPGTSTKTFTLSTWPLENPPCVLPDTKPAKPLNPGTAQEVCSRVADRNRKADCIFDVIVTGEPGFAKTYLLTEGIKAGTAKCEVKVNGNVILTVQATDRNDCYKQTSFGAQNCARYAPYFKAGDNLLEQYFNGTDRVNSEHCKGCGDLIKTVATGQPGWMLVSGPGITSPRVPVVVSPYPGWGPISGAQWVSVDANLGGKTGDYVYEYQFCLCAGAKEPSVSMTLLADNGATVWLNTKQIYATTGNGNFKSPPQSFTYTGSTAGWVIPGTNKIRVVVHNESSVTGLAASLTLKAASGACP